ncbi:hypothetical protein GURKE_00850 [Brevundimonas phage vB_BpoS-Gurke]|uniref:Uncharacterized protein n=1 Tax=Brevundimonas phage vB_BpoS-Gurke TaxID=2948599 RepID=A0A9E7SRW1_9CAUD|nr:hypothetical protein GURKE_00850 [Brevundimonas phage vB_BpoS-Gurke]
MNWKHCFGLASPFFVLALVAGVVGCAEEVQSNTPPPPAQVQPKAPAIAWQTKTIETSNQGRKTFVTLEPTGCVYMVAGEELVQVYALTRFGSEMPVGCRPGGKEAMEEALAAVPTVRRGH